ncbi:MAG: hypothetical protein ACE5F1_01485 [Planctomycetota bacterium]
MMPQTPEGKITNIDIVSPLWKETIEKGGSSLQRVDKLATGIGHFYGYFAGGSGKFIEAGTIGIEKALSFIGRHSNGLRFITQTAKPLKGLLAKSGAFAAEAYVRTQSGEEALNAAKYGPVMVGSAALGHRIGGVLSRYLGRRIGGGLGGMSGGAAMGIGSELAALTYDQLGMSSHDIRFAAPTLVNGYELLFSLYPAYRAAKVAGDVDSLKTLAPLILQAEKGLDEGAMQTLIYMGGMGLPSTLWPSAVPAAFRMNPKLFQETRAEHVFTKMQEALFEGEQAKKTIPEDATKLERLRAERQLEAQRELFRIDLAKPEDGIRKSFEGIRKPGFREVVRENAKTFAEAGVSFHAKGNRVEKPGWKPFTIEKGKGEVFGVKTHDGRSLNDAEAQLYINDRMGKILAANIAAREALGYDGVTELPQHGIFRVEPVDKPLKGVLTVNDEGRFILREDGKEWKPVVLDEILQRKPIERLELSPGETQVIDAFSQQVLGADMSPAARLAWATLVQSLKNAPKADQAQVNEVIAALADPKVQQLVGERPDAVVAEAVLLRTQGNAQHAIERMMKTHEEANTVEAEWDRQEKIAEQRRLESEIEEHKRLAEEEVKKEEKPEKPAEKPAVAGRKEIERAYEQAKPRFKKIKTEVTRGKKTKTVEGYERQGLVIHKAPLKTWAISHQASGTALLGGFPTLREARLAAFRLLQEGKWRQPLEELEERMPLVRAIREEGIAAKPEDAVKRAIETQPLPFDQMGPETGAIRLPTEEIGKAAEKINEKVQPTIDTFKQIVDPVWFKKNWKRALTWAEDYLGEPGKKIATSGRKIDHAAGQRKYFTASELKELGRPGDFTKDAIAYLKGEMTADEAGRVAVRIAERSNLEMLEARLKLGEVPQDTREDAMLYRNGRRMANEVSERARRLADDFLPVMDELMDHANEVGIYRRLRSGEKVAVAGKGEAYFEIANALGRRMLNEATRLGGGKPSADLYRMAQQMVAKGYAKDVRNAIMRLRYAAKHSLFGEAGYLERARVKLPEEYIEWDFMKHMDALLEKAWLRIEAVREFGGPKPEPPAEGQKAKKDNRAQMPLLHEQLARIGREFEPGLEERLSGYLKHQFGNTSEQIKAEKPLVNLVSNYLTLSKLVGVLSVWRNSWQTVPNSALFPLRHTAKVMFKDMPPLFQWWLKNSKKLRREMGEKGAIRGRTSFTEIESGPLQKVTATGMAPFTTAETGNYAQSALIASRGIEAAVDAVVRAQPEGPLAKLLDWTSKVMSTEVGNFTSERATLERKTKMLGATDKDIEKALETGRFSEEVFDRMVWRFMSDTQYPLSLSSKRVWWDKHPWARLLFKFKPFALDQAGFIHKHVIRSLLQGDGAPAIRFAIGSTIVGELYNIAYDLLKGTDRSLAAMLRRGGWDSRDFAVRLLNDMGAGGFWGPIADLAFGIGDYMVGPLASTSENLRQASGTMTERPEMTLEAIKRFLRREFVAVGQAEKLYERLQKALGADERYGLQYAYWRTRVREFKERKKHPGLWGMVQGGLNSTFQGFETHQPGKNTLIYSRTREEILVGDLDQAAQMLANIYVNEPREEHKKVTQDARTALLRFSPLSGVMEEPDRSRFRERLSEKEWADAREMQAVWRRRAERVVAQARKKR